MASKKPKRDESVAGSSSKTEPMHHSLQRHFVGTFESTHQRETIKAERKKKILRLSEPATIRPKLLNSGENLLTMGGTANINQMVEYYLGIIAVSVFLLVNECLLFCFKCFLLLLPKL